MLKSFLDRRDPHRKSIFNRDSNKLVVSGRYYGGYTARIVRFDRLAIHLKPDRIFQCNNCPALCSHPRLPGSSRILKIENWCCVPDYYFSVDKVLKGGEIDPYKLFGYDLRKWPTVLRAGKLVFNFLDQQDPLLLKDCGFLNKFFRTLQRRVRKILPEGCQDNLPFIAEVLSTSSVPAGGLRHVEKEEDKPKVSTTFDFDSNTVTYATIDWGTACYTDDLISSWTYPASSPTSSNFSFSTMENACGETQGDSSDG